MYADELCEWVNMDDSRNPKRILRIQMVLYRFTFSIFIYSMSVVVSKKDMRKIVRMRSVRHNTIALINLR